MNIEKYLNNRGTVLSDDLNKEIVPENTFLWTLQLYILAILNYNKEVQGKLYENMLNFFHSCIGEDGYFVNIPIKEFKNPKDKKPSKDQLIAYAAFSCLIKTDHAKTIASQLKFFKYKDNFIHPKEYAALKIMGGKGNIFWRAIYTLTNMWTFSHGTKTRPKLHLNIINWFKTFKWTPRSSVQKTDGELLYWVTRECCGVISRGLDEYANTWIKHRFNGWSGVHEQYFKQGHPITLLSKEFYGN